MAAAQDAEGDSFQRMNWAMVLMLQFLMGIIYSALIPSMHQLVVSPTLVTASSANNQQGVNTTVKVLILDVNNRDRFDLDIAIQLCIVHVLIGG